MTDDIVLSNRRETVIVAASIFLLALFVRLCAIWATAADEIFFAKYRILANELWQNHLWAARPFSYSPLYCYFLAFCQGLAGDSVTRTLLAQAVLGAISCVLVFAIARPLLGLGWAAACGLLAALSRSFVLYDINLLSDFLGLLCQLLFIAVWYRWQRQQTLRWCALLGAICGLCILQRPNSMVLLVLTAVAWWWLIRPWRFWLRHVLVYGASAAFVVLPVVVQNFRTAGEISVQTGVSGYVLYSGNNAYCFGFRYLPPELLWYGETHARSPHEQDVDLMDARLALRIAEQVSGEQMSSSACSRWYFARSALFFWHYPGDALALLLRKLWLTFHSYEPHDTTAVLLHNESVGLLAPVRYGWLLPLGILGLFVSLGEWRRWLPVHLLLISQCLLLVMFYVVVRFRLAIEAIMLWWCLLALRWLMHNFLAHRWRTLALGAMVVAAGLLISQCVSDDLADRIREADVTFRHEAANWAYETGDIGLAEHYAVTAIASEDNPHSGSTLDCQRLLATIYAAGGRQQQNLARPNLASYSPEQTISHFEQRRRLSLRQREKLAEMYAAAGNKEKAAYEWRRLHCAHPALPEIRYRFAMSQADKAPDLAYADCLAAVRDGLLLTRWGMAGAFYLAERHQKRHEQEAAQRWYIQAARQAYFVPWITASPDADTQSMLERLRTLGYLK